MRKKILVIAAFLTGLAVTLSADVIPKGETHIRQLTKRDSILIADRLAYGFTLTEVPDSEKVAFPVLEGDLGENLLMLPGWQVDTLKTYKARRDAPVRRDIRAEILLQAFDSGTYRLPPLSAARIRGEVIDTLVFIPSTIRVETMPIDTATFVMNDIKGQMTIPVTFREIAPWLFGGLVLAALVALAVILIVRHRRKTAPKEEEPAHIVALRKLDAYRGDKFWEPEKQKVFYSGVTDALREYILARFGVSALEMTTAEIFKELEGEEGIPEELRGELKDLFERADYVKFAKFTATREENASVLPLAVNFVTSTYQAEVEKEVDDVL